MAKVIKLDKHRYSAKQRAVGLKGVAEAKAALNRAKAESPNWSLLLAPDNEDADNHGAS